MSYEQLEDFADEANNLINKFTIEFTLSPKLMLSDNYCFDILAWESVKFGEEEVNRVPNDKRGIYAFIVTIESDTLPPNSYVLYIGIAGKNSKRSLRERYRDYLNERKVMIRGGRVARMIGCWHNVLRYYFVPVDEAISSEKLQELELQLNSALLPPCSRGDLKAEIKNYRRAFV